MIRFRHEEDERRYLALRAEIYRRVAANLPAQLVSGVLRNFGKLEQLLCFEGLRQGMAVAALSNFAEDRKAAPNVGSLKAFQAHAVVYGSTDTPLRSVEEEWLTKMGLPPDTDGGAWLDSEPMRYAPQTLAEWEKEEAPTPIGEDLETIMERIGHDVKDGADLGVEERNILAIERTDRIAAEAKQLVKRYEAPAIVSSDTVSSETEVEPPAQPESPMFVEQVRDALKPLLATGWQPENWGSLILKLHQTMQVDAAFLDIQLCTHVGRAMLDQCGLQQMAPGAAISLRALMGEGD